MVDDWEQAKKVLEMPDEIQQDHDDLPIHRAYCQPSHGPEELESLNDKRMWVRNNCRCIKELATDAEEAIHCVDDPKHLDRILGFMNMCKRTLETTNIDYLPKVGKIDKFVSKKRKVSAPKTE